MPFQHVINIISRYLELILLKIKELRKMIFTNMDHLIKCVFQGLARTMNVQREVAFL